MVMTPKHTLGRCPKDHREVPTGRSNTIYSSSAAARWTDVKASELVTDAKNQVQRLTLSIF